MYKVNLSSVNFCVGPPDENAFYLPYSVGILWGYASTIPAVRDKWELGHIGWRRDDIDEIYRSVADCDVLGLSTYIWNRNYNYALAKKVKAYNPSVKILLGGPEIPISRDNIFEEMPWADMVVKKEGERTFAEILAHIDDVSGVKGILINQDGKRIDTGDALRIRELNEIPSPYTSGIFADLINGNSDVKWNAVMETNRGCPYQCTFCDWGSMTYSKVTKFDLNRVFAELEWMSANQIDYLSIADANFGMFLDRDNAIADKIIELQKATGYPKRLNFSWAKNHKIEIVNLIKKLYVSGFNNGLTVSNQTLTESVLDNIKRKNLPSNKLEDTFALCSKSGIPVTTELILGLPGETLASWKDTVYEILELGIDGGLDMYNAQMLENAEMNLAQRQEFDIKTVVLSNAIFNGVKDDVPEGLEIITATKDMPADDLKRAMLFNWFIHTFHVNGHSHWFSRFLKKRKIVDYAGFYELLWSEVSNDIWFKEEISIAEKSFDGFLRSKILDEFKIISVELTAYNIYYSGVMRRHAYSLDIKYRDLIKRFIEKNYSQHFSPGLIEDLLDLNENWLIKFDELNSYPRRLSLTNNIVGHIIHDSELEKPCELLLKSNEDANMTLDTFLQNFFYKRRRNFARASIEVLG